MDHLFDALTKSLARSTSRREALKLAGVGGAGMFASLLGVRPATIGAAGCAAAFKPCSEEMPCCVKSSACRTAEETLARAFKLPAGRICLPKLRDPYVPLPTCKYSGACVDDGECCGICQDNQCTCIPFGGDCGQNFNNKTFCCGRTMTAICRGGKCSSCKTSGTCQSQSDCCESYLCNHGSGMCEPQGHYQNGKAGARCDTDHDCELGRVCNGKGVCT